MFNLSLNYADINKLNGTRCSGAIEIQSFKETFTSNIEFWSTKDYLLSWKNAVELLFNTNFSVFLTDVSDPQFSNYISGFIVFALEDVVFVQQKIFFKNHYDLNDVVKLKFPRRDSLVLINEDGDAISTWKCSIGDVNSFYKELRSKIANKNTMSI